MKVLVTGGTGVVGRSAVDHLVRAGHTVRLLSRHAEDDARQWASGVEARTGDVSDAGSVFGAADGCDAVLHVAGIVAESPPEVTFDAVNVEGTRNLVREASRAGVERFVHVSSLGAERGESGYHRSKKAAEDVVRSGFSGRWMVCRPGNVYGPGDEVISLLLKMVRTLPAVPVVSGDQEFQPVWVEDVGQALARAVEGEKGWGQVLEMAGPETTTTNRLLELMEKLTGRSIVRVPVPEFLAKLGTQAAGLVGVDLPVNQDQLVMLAEGNVIGPGGTNALSDVFGVEPTRLAEGLSKLADAMPEKLPSEGTGRLHRERFWADIRGSGMTPEQVLALVRDQFHTLPPDGIMEVAPEPGPPAPLEEGATMTLAVPVRGNVQVRVQEVTPRAITSVTLEGHFFAGVIRFMAEEPEPGTVRFEVRTYNRAATLLDRVGIRTVGKVAQTMAWGTVVEEVVRRSGGTAPDGVETVDETLDEEDAKDVEKWTEEMVMRRRRAESPEQGEGGTA
ncbi:MAG TPA: DUF1990 family protein [Longimicrobiaceae bacterium]|jgi:NADH dehydrogenase|nr:DUF1990 family protein [Longimicrobiaceae bacterium]